jgi:hypothetical protein
MSGMASIPGAFSVSTDQVSYNSGDEFDYEGKVSGVMYVEKADGTRYGSVGGGGKSTTSGVNLAPVMRICTHRAVTLP